MTCQLLLWLSPRVPLTRPDYGYYLLNDDYIYMDLSYLSFIANTAILFKEWFTYMYFQYSIKKHGVLTGL